MKRLLKLVALPAVLVAAGVFAMPSTADAGWGYGYGHSYGYQPYVSYRHYTPTYYTPSYYSYPVYYGGFCY